MRKNVLALCLALIATMSMSACATAPSSQACPELASYSAREQIAAADEMAEIPEGSVIGRMIEDYLRLRDQWRAICEPGGLGLW